MDTKFNVGGVEKQIKELNSHIANMVAVVTGTTGNTVGAATNVDYPAGYTKDNCVIVGFMYFDVTLWRAYGILNANNPCVMTVTLADKIGVTPRENVGINMSFKVALYKYT